MVASIDWFSRYVLSWRLSNTLDVSFCREALEEALGKGIPEIFNSDQDSQFTSNDFIGILLNKGIAISMDSRGRVFDNIFTERLWRRVKYEEVYVKDYRVCKDAREGMGKYFHFITIGGTINHWDIKRRMGYIMGFLLKRREGGKDGQR